MEKEYLKDKRREKEIKLACNNNRDLQARNFARDIMMYCK